MIDAAESLTNAIIGLMVSWAATYLILGYSASESVGVTALFFSLSFTRQWALRAVFRRLS